MRQWIAVIFTFVAVPTFAASIYKKALDTKTDHYLTSGVFIGGESGPGFTLLNVRRQASLKLGMERVIIDVGDAEGKPLHNQVGYFHVSVEKNPPRLVIDMSQVRRSQVSEMQLAKMFSASPYIQKVELNMDRDDGSTYLILKMKSAMAAEVFEMPSSKKASRVVIDLKKAKL